MESTEGWEAGKAREKPVRAALSLVGFFEPTAIVRGGGGDGITGV